MRNSKKLIAVIMTIAILASMMVPALAAVSYQTEADKLVAAGLMKGTGTSLDLESKLNRIQGIVFTIRAMGVEGTAAAMSEADITAALANVEDADMIPAWGRPHAAYAVKNNITNGVGGAAAGKIKFDSYAPLSGAQFTVMMLRALGYTGITLTNCFDKAQAVGMLTASKVVAFGTMPQLNRDAAAYIIFSTVQNGMVALAGGVTPSAVKLINNLVTAGAVTSTAAVAFGYVAPTPAPAPALTVSSITALNAKQIQVVFSAAVNEASVETATNYEVYDLGGSTKMAGTYVPVMQADGKTVIITLVNDATTALTNLSNAKVVVTTGVKDAAGVALASNFTSTTVLVNDTARPTIVKAEQTAPTKVKVTFNEPVKDASGGLVVGTDNFKFDNGAYIISSVANADVAGYSVEVTLGTTITAGTHTIAVNPVAASDLVDFVGFEVAENSSISFAVVPDTTGPAFTLKSATQTSAVFQFNESIVNYNDANVSYRHSINNAAYGVLGSDTTNVVYSASDKTVTVNFNAAGKPIPVGTVTFYIEYVSSTGTKIQDTYSNNMAAGAVSGVVTADSTKPTVTVAMVTDSNTQIKVTASEAVTGGTTAANYVLKNAAGTSIAFTVAVGADANTYILTTAALSGAYTLKITGLKDTAVVANTMDDYTASFTVADTIVPFVTAQDGTTAGSNFFTQADAMHVRIYFSEAMNTTDLATLANYQGTNPVANPTAANVAADGKSVYLTFAANVAGDIIVAQLRDAAGNKMATLSKTLTTAAGSKVGFKSGTNYAIAMSATTVKIYLNDLVTGIAATDFGVDKNGGDNSYAAGSVGVATEDGKSVITVTLADADKIALDQWNTVAPQVRTRSDADASATSTKNAYDVAVDLAPTDLVDGVAPVLATTNPITTMDADGNGKIDHIRIEFSEKMNKNFVSADKFTVTDYTVLDAYAATVAPAGAEQAGRTATMADSKYIYVTVVESGFDTAATPTVTIATGLKDIALNSDGTVKGNAYAGLSTATAAVDAAAPVLLSAKTTAAKTLELTYSEKITVTAAAPTQWVLDVDGGGATAADVTSANTASAANAGATITLTITTATFTTGTAIPAATITYTAGAATVTDGTNAAATPKTITGLASGF